MKKERKAIYVDTEVFELFKKMANANGRKYSAFLELVLKGKIVVGGKK
jgi:hypothetical protein